MDLPRRSARRKGRALTPQEVSEVVQTYRAGKTLQMELAVDYGVSVSQISKAIRKAA